MQAVIINIGDELLIGQVVNTNASWMAAQLELENIHVKRIITIGDSQQEIVRFLDQNIGEVALVLLTGGLGLGSSFLFSLFSYSVLENLLSQNC